MNLVATYWWILGAAFVAGFGFKFGWMVATGLIDIALRAFLDWLRS